MTDYRANKTLCPRCGITNDLNPDAPRADQFCWKCNGPLGQAEVERMTEMHRIWEQQKKDYAAIRRSNQ